jgi:hypothetical protein
MFALLIDTSTLEIHFILRYQCFKMVSKWKNLHISFRNLSFNKKIEIIE